MKDNIVLLINHISALAPTSAPSDIQQLFEQYSLEAIEVPERLSLHFDSLRELKQIVETYHDKNTQLQNLRAQQLKLDECNSLESSLLKTRSNLEEKLAQCKKQLIGPIQNKYDLLLQEAIELKIPCTKDSSTEQLIHIKRSAELELDELIKTLEQLNGLQQRFAVQLSMPELNTKHEEINDDNTKIIKGLEKIKSDMLQLPLSDGIKQRLIQDFKASVNTADLIDSYRNKIEPALSYKSLSNWAMGKTDSNYNQQQMEFSHSVSFLQLLQEQKLLNLKGDGLKINKELLDTAVTNAQDSTEQKNCHQLLVETTKILNSLPILAPINELKPPSSAADYYLILLNTMPLIGQTIAERKNSLVKVAELVTLSSELEQLKNNLNFKTISNEPIIDNESDQFFQYKRLINDLQLSHQFETDIREQINSLKTELAKSTPLEELINQTISLEEQATYTLENIQKLPLAFTSLYIPEDSISAIELPLENFSPISRAELSEFSAELPYAPSNEFDLELEEDEFHSEDIALPSKEPILEAEEPVTQSKKFVVQPEEPQDSEMPTEKIEGPTEDSDVSIEKPEVPNEDSEGHIEDSEVPSEESEVSVEESDVPTKDSPLTTPDSQVPRQNSKIQPVKSLVQPVQSVLQHEKSEMQVPEVEELVVQTKPFVRPSQEFELQTDESVMQFDKPNEYQKSIKLWHDQNRTHLQTLAQDIQNWYSDLYQAVQPTLTNETSLYKVCHLIKDILFELEHKNNQDVIREYMRLCPEPSKDFYILLDFKPGLIILNEERLNCPMELKPHYLHCMKLKKEHPVEAELLTQAIRSIHLMRQDSNSIKSPISENKISRISSDPRYLPLKRHRGFLRVWEAIEDFCRLLIGKITGQPEYAYNKIPCFFSTRSNQILEKEEALLPVVTLS